MESVESPEWTRAAIMEQALAFRNGRARFVWRQTATVLADLARAHELVVAEDGKGIRAAHGSLRIRLPAVCPLGQHRTIESYVAALPDSLGLTLIVLLQAGAAALGVVDENTGFVRHKAHKKYVIRGHGRAQSTFLKTRGKSRYGSRLRLQNARRLLVATNARLHDWIEQLGPPDRAFVSCPVRTRNEWFATKPPPPLARDAFVRIPLDVHVPCFAELQRVWWELCRGTVELDE